MKEPIVMMSSVEVTTLAPDAEDEFKVDTNPTTTTPNNDLVNLDAFDDFLDGICPATPVSKTSGRISSKRRRKSSVRVVNEAIGVIDGNDDDDTSSNNSSDSDSSEDDDEDSIYNSPDGDSCFEISYRRKREEVEKRIGEADKATMIEALHKSGTLEALLHKSVDKSSASYSLPTLELANEVRRNINVKDRKHKMKKVKQCFVASHLVDYLVESGNARTRKDAIKLGKELQGRGLFHHVNKEHQLDDNQKLYRFLDPSCFVPAAAAQPNNNDDNPQDSLEKTKHTTNTSTKSDNYLTSGSVRRNLSSTAKSLKSCPAHISKPKKTVVSFHDEKEVDEDIDQGQKGTATTTMEDYDVVVADDVLNEMQQPKRRKPKDELSMSEHSCARPKFRRHSLYAHGLTVNSDREKQQRRKHQTVPKRTSSLGSDKDEGQEQPPVRPPRRTSSLGTDKIHWDVAPTILSSVTTTTKPRSTSRSRGSTRNRRRSSSADPDNDERQCRHRRSASRGSRNSRSRNSSCVDVEDDDGRGGQRPSSSRGSENLAQRRHSERDDDMRNSSSSGGSDRRRSQSNGEDDSPTRSSTGPRERSLSVERSHEEDRSRQSPRSSKDDKRRSSRSRDKKQHQRSRSRECHDDTKRPSSSTTRDRHGASDSLGASMHGTRSRRSNSKADRPPQRSKGARPGLMRQMSQPTFSQRSISFGTNKTKSLVDDHDANEDDNAHVRPSSFKVSSRTDRRKAARDSLGATIHGGPANSREEATRVSSSRPALRRQLSQPMMMMEGVYRTKQSVGTLRQGNSLSLEEETTDPMTVGGSADTSKVDDLVKDLRRESKRKLMTKINESFQAKNFTSDASDDDSEPMIMLKTRRSSTRIRAVPKNN